MASSDIDRMTALGDRLGDVCRDSVLIREDLEKMAAARRSASWPDPRHQWPNSRRVSLHVPFELSSSQPEKALPIDESETLPAEDLSVVLVASRPRRA